MKKIILAIFMFGIAINVNAMEYYSDYTEYEEVDGECPLSSDLVGIKKEIRYKWYKEEISDLNYILEEDIIESENLIFDDSKIKMTDFSDWSNLKPEMKTGRVIESKEKTCYKDIKDARFLEISSLISDRNGFNINELEVYAGNNKIPYKIYTSNLVSFQSFINDGNLDSKTNIKSRGFIKLDLENYYPTESLKIIINNDISLTKSIRFKLKVFHSKEDKVPLVWGLFTDVEVPNIINFDKDDFEVVSPKYEDEVCNFDNNESPYFAEESSEVYYRFKDEMKGYYTKEKIFTVDYLNEAPNQNYVREESLLKEVCLVRTREKVLIKPINIKSDNYNLKDYIKYSGSYDIKSDIDISKNGEYKVQYILPFKTIEVKANVNINRKSEAEHKPIKRNVLSPVTKATQKPKKSNEISKQEPMEKNKDNKVLLAKASISKPNEKSSSNLPVIPISVTSVLGYVIYILFKK